MAAPEDFRYCPVCGRALDHLEHEGRTRPHCVACDRIYFQDPKVAAAVLVEVEGEVLLTRRSNVPEQGKWTLPAGFVDDGEDPREAAKRECMEETGLEVEICDLLDVLYGKEHPRGASIVIVYRARILAGSLHPGDDADAVKFYGPHELPPLAFAATRTILKKWKAQALPDPGCGCACTNPRPKSSVGGMCP